ncbi:MAG: hypothetical protein GC168_11900 [Candidatus Hydrogenedens sp.]|nr:hypothetical protein [Candidatus Hydrogenedens sp.]
MQLPEHRPIPGEAAVLELHLHPDAGTIPLAPDLEAEKLPEGISLEWGTLEASDTPEGPVYTQLVTVTGASMGTFTLDGLAYTFITTPDDTPLAGEKLETEGKTVTVSIEPFEFEVVRDIRPFLWSGVAALGVALVLGLVAWAARRSRKPVEQAPGGTPAEQVQARLHQARQHRLDGDFYKVYLAFAEAAKILHPLVGEGPAPDALQRRAQEVGYKGVRPTDDEMDGVARDLERALARLKENV